CLAVGGVWRGWTAMIVLWGITLRGILYKSLARHVNHKRRRPLCVVLGQIGIISLPTVLFDTSLKVMFVISLGGIAYAIGVWFYGQKERPYFHMIWHLFILIASVFHFIAILYFM